jgi:uncharacterized protein YggE
LTLAAAAAALVAVAAFAGVGRPEAARGDVASPDTVTTTGHGVVTVVPDEASVSAGVHTQADSAAAALAQNAKLMSSVIAALKTAGGSNLQTQQVSLYPQTNDQNQVTGYVADNSVSAEAKIAGAGALIDAAVAAGANNVDGPNLDTADQSSLYAQALKDALGAAKVKAQAIAGAAGLTLGSVLRVHEGGSSAPVPMFAQAKAAGADVPIEAGTQQIQASVTVTYSAG